MNLNLRTIVHRSGENAAPPPPASHLTSHHALSLSPYYSPYYSPTSLLLARHARNKTNRLFYLFLPPSPDVRARIPLVIASLAAFLWHLREHWSRPGDDAMPPQYEYLVNCLQPLLMHRDLMVELLVERCQLTLCRCRSTFVFNPLPFHLACVGDDDMEGPLQTLGFRHRRGIF